MKGRRVNAAKGILGFQGGQFQVNSNSYKNLEAEHATNLHYFHQYNYIPAKHDSGDTKIRVFFIRRLRKINP